MDALRTATLYDIHFVVNSCWSELDIVGPTREWICCILEIVHIEVNSTVVHTPWTTAYRYFVLVDTKWITEYRHCVLVDNGQIKEYKHCVLVDIKWITGQIAGYRGHT